MELSGGVIPAFFWRAKGCVQSLEALELSAPGTKRDVTLAVSGEKSLDRPLIVVELAEGKVIGNPRMLATKEDVVVGGIQSLFGCEDPENHYLMHRRRFRFP